MWHNIGSIANTEYFNVKCESLFLLFPKPERIFLSIYRIEKYIELLI